MQRCLYTGELITEQPLSEAVGGDKVRERCALLLADCLKYNKQAAGKGVTDLFSPGHALLTSFVITKIGNDKFSKL